MMWRNVMTRVVIITTTTIIIVTLAEDHLIPSVGLGGIIRDCIHFIVKMMSFQSLLADTNILSIFFFCLFVFYFLFCFCF